jgi:dihydrofolate reductase
MPRRIIVYVATSADGYIARLDGDVAWLDRPRPKGNYGMGAFYKSVDTVVMGRKTYEVALGFGQESYAGKKNYVFSHAPPRHGTSKVEFVSTPVAEFARQLRAARGRHVWLVGGSELIASFLDEGAIDDFMIHVVPTMIGAGIALVAPRHRLVPLRLVSSRAHPDGVVSLHYRVERPRQG